MRTLYITNNYLYGGSGAIYASKCFVNSFAILSDNISIFYPIKNGDHATDIVPHAHLIPVEDKRTKFRKIIDLTLGRMHRYTVDICAYFNPQMFDVVVFDSSIVSFHLIKHARKVGLKCICIHHNYQIEFVKDDTPWYLLPIKLFWTYFSEREAVRNSHLNLTLTQTDAESLSAHYDRKAIFEVIGVCDYVAKEYTVLESNNKSIHFIITGQLASKQTEDSLIPWIQEYYPILNQICPNAELTIAGRSPSNKLIRLCHEVGITLIPSPKEMAPILAKGDIFICPTSLGSGLKLRNMDGLRTGMQVLTHIRSERGYEAMKEKGVLYSYKDKESFAHQLKQIIDHPKTKEEVLDVYNSYFSLHAGIRRLANILNKHSI